MMIAALAPYRSLPTDMIAVIPRTGGLILAPKPHKCGPPGVVSRIWHHMIGNAIHHNTMWRCAHCKVVMEFDSQRCIIGRWLMASPRDWKDAGGDE